MSAADGPAAPRFVDDGRSLWNFDLWNTADSFWVVCPGCTSRATVDPETHHDVRFVCVQCGRSEIWQNRGRGAVLFARHAASFSPGTIGIGAAVDWYFHYPLWLQTSCCGEVLWVYNLAHLAWLRQFVQAKQRTRVYNPEHGWSNRSVASRLPKWLKLAKNRDAILRAIDKLQAETG